MERVRSGYIVKVSSRLRSKDRIPSQDLRKRVLLKNFLRHQIGIKPNSLFDLREKKEEIKKVDDKKRVALKSLPSSVTRPQETTTTSDSILNDVQVNRVSSSSSNLDVQFPVVTSSSITSNVTIDHQVEPCDFEQNENDANSVSLGDPCVSSRVINTSNVRAMKINNNSAEPNAKIEKLKSCNGPGIWRRKLGLNFIRKKFRNFINISAKKRASREQRKVCVKPFKIECNAKVIMRNNTAPANTTVSDDDGGDKTCEVPLKIFQVSVSKSSTQAEEIEEERLRNESKMLTKELDYYISLYESKPGCFCKKKKLSSKNLLKVVNDVISRSKESDSNSESHLNVAQENIVASKKKVSRSLVVKVFQREKRKWYEQQRYRRLKKCYIPACGSDKFTVEQHIKHKCLPSHVSFLPYTKYMKASEYFLYLHNTDTASGSL